MKCKEVTRLISESLDRELPLGRRIAVRLHFIFCRCCARYEQNLRLLREVFRLRREQPAEPAGDSPSDSLSEDAKDRMRNILRDS